MSAYRQLTGAFSTISYFEHAAVILQWDQEVMMPKGGAGARAKALAEMAALLHRQTCDPQLRDWLVDAESEMLTDDQRANLREMRRVIDNATVLPEDLVRAKAEAESLCQHGWQVQRKENDWSGFAPNLQSVVSLAREEARVRQSVTGSQTPYDALLTLYCHGDSSDLVARVFGELKAALPDLIQQRIDRQSECQKPSCAGFFPVDSQRQLSETVMAFLGFQFDRGRLDVSSHPFSTGNFGDQRITTRYDESNFIEALYGTVHETGHARYEAGLPAEWCTQPLGRARNMSIHESQSLFFEKHIGGSPAFCEFVEKQCGRLFSLAEPVTASTLLDSVKWVEPGYIRVRADELTYPLHIILRFEIESGLINGQLEVQDIPDAWNEKMGVYFGLDTKGNYQDGCMQDIHWTMGAFGYFPSYTLGAVNAAQLRTAMEKRVGPINDIIADGDLRPITEWLAEHIWSVGCRWQSQEIVRSATGKETDAQSLLGHFRKNYLED